MWSFHSLALFIQSLFRLPSLHRPWAIFSVPSDIDPSDHIYLFLLFWLQSIFTLYIFLNLSNLLKPSSQFWPQLQALSLEISVQTKACWYVFQEIQSWCRLHLSAQKMRSDRFSKLPSILILLNHLMHNTNPIINVFCTYVFCTYVALIYDCYHAHETEVNKPELECLCKFL